MTRLQPGIVELAQAIRNGVAVTSPMSQMQILHGIARSIDGSTDGFGIRISTGDATEVEEQQDDLIAEFLGLLTTPESGAGVVQCERLPLLDGHASAAEACCA